MSFWLNYACHCKPIDPLTPENKEKIKKTLTQLKCCLVIHNARPFLHDKIWLVYSVTHLFEGNSKKCAVML